MVRGGGSRIPSFLTPFFPSGVWTGHGITLHRTLELIGGQKGPWEVVINRLRLLHKYGIRKRSRNLLLSAKLEKTSVKKGPEDETRSTSRDLTSVSGTLVTGYGAPRETRGECGR